MVEGPPARVGDMGLISSLGGFHMPRDYGACAPQLLKPTCARACAPNNADPAQPETDKV